MEVMKIYVLPPDQREPLLARRTRLFLENGTELLNLRSVSSDVSYLGAGMKKLVIELDAVDIVVVDQPPQLQTT